MTKRNRPPKRSDEDRHREAMTAAWAAVRVAWASVVVATISLAVSLPYRDIVGVINAQNLLSKSQHQRMALPYSRNEQQAATDFSAIGSNVATSIDRLPPLLSGVAYMSGTLVGVMGILKVKDRLENPDQHPLKNGAIRLVAGGGLFELPIAYSAMKNLIGADTGMVDVGEIRRINIL